MGHSQEASKFPQIVAAFGGTTTLRCVQSHLLSVACFGAFALGNGLSWTSPTLPVISLNDDDRCGTEDEDFKDCYWDNEGDAISADEASWVGGLFALGALVSSFVTAWSMGVIGRKWTMMARKKAHSFKAQLRLSSGNGDSH